MNLIDRAKNILLSPGSEWDKIAGEPATAADLYRSYIVPLAAIGPICSFIGLTVFGMSMPLIGTYRVPFMAGLSNAIVAYVFALIGVYVIALITDALAPTFGGQKDRTQALKVAAYAYTPAWLAGVFQLLPMLAVLVFLASLYGLYLLYLGLPVLMKSPREKALGYTAVIVVCAIVVAIVIGALTTAIGFGRPQVRIGPASMRGPVTPSAEVTPSSAAMAAATDAALPTSVWIKM